MICVLLFFLTASASSIPMSVLDIIDEFPNYIICLNYDNTTQDELYNFQFANRMHPGVYLTNHDINTPYDTYQLNGLQHLHVFLLKNISKVKNDLSKTINSRDVVIVFTQTILGSSDFKRICKISVLHNAGSVFIIGSNSDIVNCCYYCNRHKISLKHMEKGMSMFNNFTNFHGYPFKVGFTEFLPFFWCSYNKEKRCESYHGPEWEIVQAVSKSLNFKYNIIEYAEKGNKNAWQIMTEKIYHGEIDWAVSGITQTLERSKVLDFTRYIKIERYMAIYRSHEDHWATALFLLYSVHVSSWGIFLSIIGTATALAMVAKFSLRIFRFGNLNLVEYALMTVMYVYEQHSNKLLRQMAVFKPYVRIIFLLWISFSACISTYYKSQLASLLMVTPTDPSDAEDMIGKGFKFEVHKFDVDYLKYSCRNSTNNACKKMLQADVQRSICQSVATVLSKKVAYLGDELPLQYRALRKCNLTLEQKYSLKMATAKAIGTEWHAWPLRKYTPFVRSFSRVISRLEAAGLLQFWYQQEMGIFRELKNYHQYLHEVVSRPLSVYHFIFPFIVLILGVIMSTVVFAGELFYAKYHPMAT